MLLTLRHIVRDIVVQRLVGNMLLAIADIVHVLLLRLGGPEQIVPV